ncbi:hypothetical protein BCV70DRAFT_156522 [Testicularia cyperi]|uniref:Autophagy-related protein 14 n=1 Tax=Testicularia cyperi TaxID=1882483 RepID=A0A317XU95_9BASI|nr:hypothetical protein BCV70DRAFT_156522 [Testicularia cyperi]
MRAVGAQASASSGSKPSSSVSSASTARRGSDAAARVPSDTNRKQASASSPPSAATRNKLRHANTTLAVPSTQARGAAKPSSSSRPLPSHRSSLPVTSGTSTFTNECKQCHQQDTRFFCDPCLNSRIAAHHKEIARLTLARDRARDAVEQLLGNTAEGRRRKKPPFSHSTSQPPTRLSHLPTFLPDPFEATPEEQMDPSGSSPHSRHAPLLLRRLIQLRAERAAIIAKTQATHQHISESQHSLLAGKEALKEKRVQILARKQNLAKAWSSLEGASAPSASSTARPRPSAKSLWLPQAHAGPSNNVVVGQDAEDPMAAAWTTDVYTHYERRADLDSSAADAIRVSPADEVEDHDNTQLGAMIARCRSQISLLEQEAKDVSIELCSTRARLARETFAVFSVSPPTATTSPIARPRRREEASTSSFMAQRFSKLSERYMPGAFHHFGFDTDGGGSSAASATSTRRRQQQSSEGSDPSASLPVILSNDWTIAGLAMPLPSEIRRHDRDSINGAITYTVQLLQILAAYLGVALPFPPDMQLGRLTIKPDPLWDGGGGSSTKPLHLSSAAYALLTAANAAASSATSSRQSKFNNLAESTFGLGASTLSTLESYIQLPSSSSIPWGLTSMVANATGMGTAGAAAQEPDSERHRSSESDDIPNSKVKPDQAARAFVSALVMLNYSVAYLASRQGLKIDLVTAACNPLQLLHKAINQPKLGAVAHSNYLQASSIDDLSMPQLDFEQLAQILEPTSALRPKSDAAKTSSRPNSGTAKVASRSNKILEQSYIDAGEAAASVMNIKDPSNLSSKTKSSSTQSTDGDASLDRTRKNGDALASRQSASKESTKLGSASRHAATLVDGKGRQLKPAQPPPASLDFLRQRGRDATKSKASTTSRDTNLANEPAEKKPGPGAVIFNGVEVGVGNIDSGTRRSSSTRNKGEQRRSRRTVEDEWDLV